MTDITPASSPSGHNPHADARHPDGLRAIDLDRPWRWLAAGWDDLRRAPTVGLTYGALAVVTSYALTLGLWAYDLAYLVLPLGAGFVLVGPILAVGLYETSRRLQAGQPVRLADAAMAFRRNPLQIALLGLVLTLALLFWVRVALLLFALFFNQQPPTLDALVAVAFFSSTSLPFLIVGHLFGGMLAAAVFALTAISVPLLLDRPGANVFQAIATSIAAVMLNLRAMALWAALIVVFITAGIATVYLGLLVTLPLIGHASWHAYKDLVGPEA
jgi:uncharacterized membrane protein